MSNYTDSHFEEYGENTSWFKAMRLIPEKSKVLDVGCSSGNFGAELIARKSCTVDGLELDIGDVKLAERQLRKVYNLNIETDDISVIKDRYDVIYMGDVVEHLFHPIETLTRCKSLLKKDGVVVFSIPNMAHVSIRLLLLKGDFSYTETGLLDKTHVHFFNLDEIKRVFKEAGYDISHLDYVEKDYPKRLIEEWCDEIGIQVKKKFIDRTKQIDAAAFQFIGVASKGKKVSKKLPKFGPVDFFESFHNNTINALNERISILEKDSARLASDAAKWRKLRGAPVVAVARKLIKKVKR